ncbi:C39 family peptidase [Anaerocolumna sp.]|uniref:C39 family peptidase n=1 Tax=Anaerocolumna sp. TaxID=2041569 RepID=UPI0028B17FFE|nr:C39 family peptidase [Anaerocolumna sp.]
MKIKMSVKKKLSLLVIICVTAVLGTFLTVNLYILISTPKQYMITSENYFDYQPHYECSGYSSAYVLRSLGEDMDGLELYNDISKKNSDGTVTPKNLVGFLSEKGYSANLCSGTALQLKHEISKGTPVIVFVRTSPKENYYHYLPIVGYDEDNIYAAESLQYKTNAENQHYNRIISNSDFEMMWETGVFRKNTYITIKLK